MQKQVSHCPFCGTEFEETNGATDSRSAPGYRCGGCEEILELRVNRFPLA